MRKVWLAIALIGVVLGASNIFAKEKSIGGTWTLTVEQHFGLKLVLEQKNTVVTGRSTGRTGIQSSSSVRSRAAR